VNGNEALSGRRAAGAAFLRSFDSFLRRLALIPLCGNFLSSSASSRASRSASQRRSAEKKAKSLVSSLFIRPQPLLPQCRQRPSSSRKPKAVGRNTADASHPRSKLKALPSPARDEIAASAPSLLSFLFIRPFVAPDDYRYPLRPSHIHRLIASCCRSASRSWPRSPHHTHLSSTRYSNHGRGDCQRGCESSSERGWRDS
jgi:hypothetical protein